MGAPGLAFETWDVRCWHDEGPGPLSAVRLFPLHHLQLSSQKAVPQVSHSANFCPKLFRPSNCRLRRAGWKGPSGRRTTTISTSRPTPGSWRNCAIFIAIRSSAGLSPEPRTGSGRVTATTRRACVEPSRLNRSGQRAREAGNCPNGCTGPALPPRSPRLRMSKKSGCPRSGFSDLGFMYDGGHV